ncbi:MAG: efflux RND transporter periplasmic adaptor subunit [Coriobacteriales bacterium]|nr:efflux RND transporter periplasmic adaptor subunit [Coriobacteriales bacterium]
MVGRTRTFLILGGVILASVAIGLGLSGIVASSMTSVLPENVVEQAVESGSVSQVVTGAGALASQKTESALVPADLEVQRVFVHEGDEVEIGTPIARVTASSVREKRLAIEENIDSLQKELDNLNGGSEQDLKRQVLKEQIADLKIDRDTMARLQETCVLESTRTGVIRTVALVEGARTGKVFAIDQGGSSSSSATDAQAATGDSAKMASAVVGPEGSGMVLYAAVAPAPDPMLQTASEVEVFAEEVPAGNNESNNGGNAVGNDAAGNDQAPSNSTSEGSNAGQGTEQQPDGGETRRDVPPHQLITGTVRIAVTPPSTGKVPQDTVLFPEGAPYTATSVAWAPEDKQFAPQTEYVCTVYLTANEGFGFSLDRSKIDVTVPSSVATRHEVLDLNDDGIAETLKVEAAFTATQPVLKDGSSADISSADLSSLAADGLAVDGLSADSLDFDLGDADLDEATSSSSLTKAGASYSDTEAVALTVTPAGKMFLDVKVDELDVLKLKEGQKAQIAIDAMPGETFEGTITKIADTAERSTQEGGSVKFTTRIELPPDDRMRYGMSAKATVVVEEAQDVMLVPIEAISQQDGQTVVFTAVGADGTLASPVVVQTGLSNENQVEVKSGLKLGDTVYYIPAKPEVEAETMV